jgi:hypothetical protein
MPDFYGRPTGVVENSHLRLEYLVQAGPRIVRLNLPGIEGNLLGEVPEIGWDTEHGYFELFGGHRLWAAPEQPGLSYLPDSEGLSVIVEGEDVELRWEPMRKGLGKHMRISLLANRPGLHLTHTITNRFDHPVVVAPWGITVLPPGGEAYLPATPAGEGFLPDRSLVLWPYSNWNDPRLSLQRGGIQVRGEGGSPPLKVGTFAERGLCAYYRNDVLFTKQFSVEEGEYPDRGCNVEVYCSDGLIEVETLAPLSTILPGGSVSSVETWEFFTGKLASKKLQEVFFMESPNAK